jgi:hypothetical protein
MKIKLPPTQLLMRLIPWKNGKGLQPFAIEETENRHGEGEKRKGGRLKGGNGIEMGKEGTRSTLERESSQISDLEILERQGDKENLISLSLCTNNLKRTNDLLRTVTERLSTSGLFILLLSPLPLNSLLYFSLI